MERRPFKKKRKTAEQFGARKRKSPAAKKFSPATSHTDSAGSVQDDADSQPSTSSAHGTSSASIDETVHAALEQCFVPAVADIADARPSTSREVADIADVWPSTVFSGL